ncbi:MAG TPA: sugar ABC transporter permease, partial [Candidatus Borkfalkia avistercoris]|nr:sugar ABC transporter permease [Candidatus Borkfalkia avistercoris]
MQTEKRKRGLTPSKRGQTLFLTVMLIVPIVQWAIFWLYVNIQTILLGFQTRIGEWTLSNFRQLFYELGTAGSNINTAVLNTLRYFATNVCVIMVLALIISYFMFRQIKGARVFRIIFYLPAIISTVAMTTVFENFIAPTGPVGYIFESLGREAPELLADSSTATNTIIFYTVWTGFGTNILLFTGAMSRVPMSVLESAKLDGAGMGREIVSIILPLIWPTISTLLILNCTSIFSASGPILLFTSGGYGTTTIGYWIFDMVYNYNS